MSHDPTRGEPVRRGDRVADMNDALDHYTLVSSAFLQRLDAITEDQWTSPTPCDEWDVRALVDHSVTVHHMMLANAGLPREAPGPDADIAAAWREARQAVLDALADDETASKKVMSPMGETQFSKVVGGLLSSDTLFHTWDLARATGQDETLDPAACERVLGAMGPMEDFLRGAGLFKDRIDVAGDADAQTRMLAFGGRQP